MNTTTTPTTPTGVPPAGRSDEARFAAQLVGWTGIVFAVVFGASFLVVGAPPDLDASAEEVKRYMLDNRTGGLLQMLLFALAAPLFVSFVSGLRDRHAIEDVATRHLARVGSACGGLFIAVLVAGAGAFFAGVWVEDIGASASADVLRLAWDISYVEYLLANPLAAAMLVAVGWCVLRSRSMPAWFGWASIAVGVAFAVSTMGVLVVDLAAVGFFVYLAFVLWVLLAGILLVRQAPAA